MCVYTFLCAHTHTHAHAFTDAKVCIKRIVESWRLYIIAYHRKGYSSRAVRLIGSFWQLPTEHACHVRNFVKRWKTFLQNVNHIAWRYYRKFSSHLILSCFVSFSPRFCSNGFFFLSSLSFVLCYYFIYLFIYLFILFIYIFYFFLSMYYFIFFYFFNLYFIWYLSLVSCSIFYHIFSFRFFRFLYLFFLFFSKVMIVLCIIFSSSPIFLS